MRNLLSILIMTFLSFGIIAEEDNSSDIKESDYENGCDNKLDDDLDGVADYDDEDCQEAEMLYADLVGDANMSEYQPYLVWGVAIALISSVGSDSGTGTATTD